MNPTPSFQPTGPCLPLAISPPTLSPRFTPLRPSSPSFSVLPSSLYPNSPTYPPARRRERSLASSLTHSTADISSPSTGSPTCSHMHRSAPPPLVRAINGSFQKRFLGRKGVKRKWDEEGDGDEDQDEDEEDDGGGDGRGEENMDGGCRDGDEDGFRGGEERRGNIGYEMDKGTGVARDEGYFRAGNDGGAQSVRSSSLSSRQTAFATRRGQARRGSYRSTLARGRIVNTLNPRRESSKRARVHELDKGEVQNGGYELESDDDSDNDADADDNHGNDDDDDGDDVSDYEMHHEQQHVHEHGHEKESNMADRPPQRPLPPGYSLAASKWCATNTLHTKLSTTNMKGMKRVLPSRLSTVHSHDHDHDHNHNQIPHSAHSARSTRSTLLLGSKDPKDMTSKNQHRETNSSEISHSRLSGISRSRETSASASLRLHSRTKPLSSFPRTLGPALILAQRQHVHHPHLHQTINPLTSSITPAPTPTPTSIPHLNSNPPTANAFAASIATPSQSPSPGTIGTPFSPLHALRTRTRQIALDDIQRATIEPERTEMDMVVGAMARGLVFRMDEGVRCAGGTGIGVGVGVGVDVKVQVHVDMVSTGTADVAHAQMTTRGSSGMNGSRGCGVTRLAGVMEMRERTCTGTSTSTRFVGQEFGPNRRFGACSIGDIGGIVPSCAGVGSGAPVAAAVSPAAAARPIASRPRAPSGLRRRVVFARQAGQGERGERVGRGDIVGMDDEGGDGHGGGESPVDADGNGDSDLGMDMVIGPNDKAGNGGGKERDANWDGSEGDENEIGVYEDGEACVDGDEGQGDGDGDGNGNWIAEEEEEEDVRMD